MLKKVGVGAASIVVALAMMTGTAIAHQCTNASRSDRGNQAVAENSKAWVTFRTIAQGFLSGEIGLCSTAVNHVLDGLEEAGFDVDTLVHSKTTLAWGMAENSPNAERLLTDGKGVDYIDWAWIEATATPLIIEAFDLCAARAEAH